MGKTKLFFYNISPKLLFDFFLQGFTYNLTSGVNYVRDYVFKKARETVMKKTGGLYPAPLKILDVTKVGCDKGLASGYEAEAKGFGELVMSSEAKALMGLFFAQVQLSTFIFFVVGVLRSLEFIRDFVLFTWVYLAPH